MLQCLFGGNKLLSVLLFNVYIGFIRELFNNLAPKFSWKLGVGDDIFNESEIVL